MKRFDFDSFDSEITAALKEYALARDPSSDVERSLGHAVLMGEMTAEEALDNLTAYEQAQETPEANS